MSTGMNGMVNATLEDRVNRIVGDVIRYDVRRMGIEGDLEAIAKEASFQSVQSVVGYLLADLRRLNEQIDSLALDTLIYRHANSLGLVVARHGGSFMTKEKR